MVSSGFLGYQPLSCGEALTFGPEEVSSYLTSISLACYLILPSINPFSLASCKSKLCLGDFQSPDAGGRYPVCCTQGWVISGIRGSSGRADCLFNSPSCIPKEQWWQLPLFNLSFSSRVGIATVGGYCLYHETQVF